MRYRSVSGQGSLVGFREALFMGSAPDGGLFVPESLPRLPDDVLNSLANQSLHSIGGETCRLFIEDIPFLRLKEILQDAWNFPIPLTHLHEDIHLLELFHGPTLAFKDIGARFMARIVSHYLEEKRRDITVLVATSGDTGSAVAHGFLNVPHTSVVILYPSGRISRLQEQQMTTLGGNIRALEVEGSFDDCQDLVKKALGDRDIAAKKTVTTANSINLARLIPQIAYYVWGLAQWITKHPGTIPLIVVPSGNLGNLTAGVYASRMGAPIAGLLAASNANSVFPEYLADGSFAPRSSIQTMSSAMDVGNPSNLARLQELFLSEGGEISKEISGMSVSDDETIGEIRRVYEMTGTVIDPHTAVGMNAARRLRARDGIHRPIIVMSTAHPGKFPEVIEEAIGTSFPPPPELQSAMSLPKQSILLRPDFEQLKSILRN